MNKLKYLLIILALVITTHGNTPIFLDVFAGNVPSTNLPTACGDNKYSVDKIVGYDNFQNIACYSETEFSQAYQKMLENAPNSVIRHNSSESPLNIVAADRAVAYSMNDTYLREDTLIIYADKDITSNYTYINQSNTLYYYDTYVIGTPATVKPENLSVLIEVNGAKGYVKLKGIDIIPMIYVENRIDKTIADPTKDTSNSWYVAYQTRTSTGAFTSSPIRPNISYYIVPPIDSAIMPTSPSCGVTNGDLILYTDTATSSFCKPVGKAPSWLPAGKYYSANGIDFFYDIDLVNPVLNNGVPGKHYNYYSYLPLRSKSNYTAQELNNYIKTVLTTTTEQDKSVIFENEQLFINAQNSYGMNALLILAMGAQESEFGKSGYAQLPANLNGLVVYNADTGTLIESTTVSQFCTQYPTGKYKDEFGDIRYCLGRNNIFGYAAYDSDPNNAAAFPSLEAGINEHMGRNLRFYLDAMNTNQFSSSIGNKGVGINTRYASDPWWSVKIASIAYQADRYLGLKDYDYHQIGLLKNDVSRDFYSDYSLGTKLYSINAKASTYTVVVLEQNVDKYKVQSTNPIANLNTVVVSPSGSWMKPVDWTPTLTYKYSSETEPYDWAKSFDYKSSSDITLINSAKNPIKTLNSSDKSIISVREISWLENARLYVSGYSAFLQTDMSNLNISHKLTAINLDDSSLTYDFQLNIAPAEFELKLLYPFDYSKAWFDGEIDLATLPNGFYRFEITTFADGIKSVGNFFNSLDSAPRVNTINVEETTYGLYFNNKASMRYELSKEKGLTDINYSPIIPSQIPSISAYTSLLMNGSILSLDGFSFINETNMGDADNVRHTLFLVNDNGNKFSFPLTTYKSSNLNLKGLDHTNAWLKNDAIDLVDIPIGRYKIYIFTETNQYSDLVSMYDFRSVGNLSFDFETKRFEFKVNSSQRNKYYIEVSEIID